LQQLDQIESVVQEREYNDDFSISNISSPVNNTSKNPMFAKDDTTKTPNVNVNNMNVFQKPSSAFIGLYHQLPPDCQKAPNESILKGISDFEHQYGVLKQTPIPNNRTNKSYTKSRPKLMQIQEKGQEQGQGQNLLLSKQKFANKTENNDVNS